MEKYILVNKPRTWTPLQSIMKLRKDRPDLNDIKMAYAGRLDPMAEGLLIILLDEECKQRKLYENLTKVYEVEVLCGISTDTYDIMGLIQCHSLQSNLSTIKQELPNILKKLTGTFIQSYPPFSSVRVNGHPLFYWARMHKLDTIKIPSKKVEIVSIDIVSYRTISVSTYIDDAVKKIKRVRGAFRQEKIIENYNSLSFDPTTILPVITLRITCSSGTYVRSIAHEIGVLLNIPTCAFRIHRTKIGDFMLQSHEQF